MALTHQEADNKDDDFLEHPHEDDNRQGLDNRHVVVHEEVLEVEKLPDAVVDDGREAGGRGDPWHQRADQNEGDDDPDGDEKFDFRRFRHVLEEFHNDISLWVIDCMYDIVFDVVHLIADAENDAIRSEGRLVDDDRRGLVHRAQETVLARGRRIFHARLVDFVIELLEVVRRVDQGNRRRVRRPKILIAEFIVISPERRRRFLGKCGLFLP